MKKIRALKMAIREKEKFGNLFLKVFIINPNCFKMAWGMIFVSSQFHSQGSI